MDEAPWKITGEAERAWLRTCFGRGAGLKVVEELLGPGWCQWPERAVDSSGRSAAHIFADFGWDEALGMLLASAGEKNGKPKGNLEALLRGRDGRGLTPLHLAIQSKVAPRILLQMSLARDTTDREGNTPMHTAVIARNHEALEAMVELLSDPFVTNHSGATAYQLSTGPRGTEQLEELLHFAARMHSGGLSCVLVAGIVVVYCVQLGRRKVTIRASPMALTSQAYNLLSKETMRKSLSCTPPQSFEPPPGSRSSTILGEYGRRRGMTSFAVAKDDTEEDESLATTIQMEGEEEEVVERAGQYELFCA